MQQRSVPVELLQSLRHVDGFDENAFVLEHRQPKQVTSVRVNPAKINSKASELFPDSEKVPWSTVGRYLDARPQFIFDPRLHAGAYYVQEPSGMFLEECVKQSVDTTQPVRVLDLCAAPGGKSTLLHSAISRDSLLVSNEVIKSRASILVENMSKWGGENVIVTNNDPRDFARLQNFFDLMVVDAPCSGSGLFRREPDAIDEWSPDAVVTCSLRQQRILDDAYACLKNNGVLIYSTCSYSPEEDEMISEWLMSDHEMQNIRINIKEEWGIVETQSQSGAYGYRFFPHKLKGEGFYIACFRKTDGGEFQSTKNNHSSKNRKGKSSRVSAAEQKVILPWIRKDAHLNFYHNNDEVLAFPTQLEHELLTIQSNLYIKKAGVNIGKIIRDELLPAHELALSTIKSADLPIISLKKDEALQYLRKEEVTIDEAVKGWALASYEGYHLGWLKVLGNRINNYYPKEWRILKSGTPE